MEVLNNQQAAYSLAKASSKWCLYISATGEASPDVWGEWNKAVPYLTMDQTISLLFNGPLILVCDSEEECQNLFDQTVGDDGPTDLNPYDGGCKVFALTIGPDGMPYSENT